MCRWVCSLGLLVVLFFLPGRVLAQDPAGTPIALQATVISRIATTAAREATKVADLEFVVEEQLFPGQEDLESELVGLHSVVSDTLPALATSVASGHETVMARQATLVMVGWDQRQIQAGISSTLAVMEFGQYAVVDGIHVVFIGVCAMLICLVALIVRDLMTS